jgi:hypothetical protein
MTTSKIDKQSAYTEFFNGVHSAGAASDPTQNKSTGDMVGESYLIIINAFFSEKSHESYSSNALESTLDNYIGTGSQSIEKANKPLAPDNSTQWANGMPNSTEFIKSASTPAGTWRAPSRNSRWDLAGRGRDTTAGMAITA